MSIWKLYMPLEYLIVPEMNDSSFLKPLNPKVVNQVIMLSLGSLIEAEKSGFTALITNWDDVSKRLPPALTFHFLSLMYSSTFLIPALLAFSRNLSING